VVVVIGIFAALAAPRVMTAITKSKQSEAKGILVQIYTMQRTYCEANNSYWGAGMLADSANTDNFATIGVQILPHARYTYEIVTADDGTNLLVRATATNLDDDVAEDVWEIDQDGKLTCISDDVLN
jgi:type II secretory pathway pseudopilin PulG